MRMQRHKTKPLYKGKCYECGKETIVSAVSPNPCSGELTGVWLRRMDEDQRIHNVGFLCQDCMKFDNSKYSFGFSGGKLGNLDLWEAYLEIVER